MNNDIGLMNVSTSTTNISEVNPTDINVVE